MLLLKKLYLIKGGFLEVGILSLSQIGQLFRFRIVTGGRKGFTVASEESASMGAQFIDAATGLVWSAAVKGNAHTLTQIFRRFYCIADRCSGGITKGKRF
jgi:hypothetical protein